MEKKKIKILTDGVIRVKGFINGPVLTPYKEDISTIFALVSSGVKVVEVCDDGTEITLTTSNFSEDHSKPHVKEEVMEEKVENDQTDDVKNEVNEEVHEEKIETTEEQSIEENVDDIESESVEEVVHSEPVVDEVRHQYNHNNNKKHNKHNKYNQQFKVQTPSIESIDLTKK